MASPMVRGVTVRDVLMGLESVEKWIRQLREALATIDPEQPLNVRPRLVATAPIVKGGQCPPGKKKPKTAKKKK